MSEENDRELLELAAKAAGIKGTFEGDCIRVPAPGLGANGFTCWMPQADDGDALRLAVRLGIAIEMHPAWVYVRAVPPGDHLRWLEITEGWAHTKDPESCVRRAIVRAAAEIGRRKP